MRKLLICYSIFRNPDHQQYSIADFLFPNLPRSITLDSCAAAATAKCIYNLEECGITVQEATLSPEQALLQSHERDLDKHDDEERFFLSRIYQQFLSSIFRRKPATFSSEWLKRSLHEKRYKQLKKDGWGQLGIHQDLPFEDFKDFTLPLIAPYFYTFILEIDQIKLEQTITTYLSRYESGKLSLSEANYFSYERTRNIGQALLDHLNSWQKNNDYKVFRPKVRSKQTKRYHDDLHTAFSKVDPEGYEAWCAGSYELPLVEDFLLEDLKGRLSITGVKVRVPRLSTRGIRSRNDDSINEEQYRRLVSRLCSTYRADPVIFFKLNSKSPPRPSQSRQSLSKIVLLEVEPSKSKTFWVYLNQDYLRPFAFNREKKTGQLIYALASKGQASYSNFRRQYQYIQSGKDFKLFTQSDYVRAGLLQRSGSGRKEIIIPDVGVCFRFLID